MYYYLDKLGAGLTNAQAFISYWWCFLSLRGYAMPLAHNDSRGPAPPRRSRDYPLLPAAARNSVARPWTPQQGGGAETQPQAMVETPWGRHHECPPLHKG